jgi:uncharacterized protein (TIGR02594 family)
MSIQPPTPPWITEARRHVGLAEIPGPRHNPTIVKWLQRLKAWWAEDETPWCGVFVAHCIEIVGLPLPKHWYRAKGWLDWGDRLSTPIPGCIVVLEREGGGHVFFALGIDKAGRIVGIGGNQGNKVSIAAFDRSRVIGYRWPARVNKPIGPMPLVDYTGSSSAGEA